MRTKLPSKATFARSARGPFRWFVAAGMPRRGLAKPAVRAGHSILTGTLACATSRVKQSLLACGSIPHHKVRYRTKGDGDELNTA